MTTLAGKKTDSIQFTLAQLQWLEKMFPERVIPVSESVDAMRTYFGQRSVIAVVRNRVANIQEIT